MPLDSIQSVKCPPLLLCVHRCPTSLECIADWATEKGFFRIAEWHPNDPIETLFDEEEKKLIHSEVKAMTAGTDQDPLMWLQHPGELLPHFSEKGLLIIAYVGPFYLLAKPTLSSWIDLLSGSCSFNWGRSCVVEVDKLIAEESALPVEKQGEISDELLNIYKVMETLPAMQFWVETAKRNPDNFKLLINNAADIVSNAVRKIAKLMEHNRLMSEIQRFGETIETSTTNFRIYLELLELKTKSKEEEGDILAQSLWERYKRLESYTKPWLYSTTQLTKQLCDLGLQSLNEI